MAQVSFHFMLFLAYYQKEPGSLTIPKVTNNKLTN